MSKNNLFEVLEVGPKAFDYAKSVAKEKNISEHEALTEEVLGYLGKKYEKEIEKDPTFLNLDNLLDGTAGIYETIPSLKGLPSHQRFHSYGDLVHLFTDYQPPDAGDFIETAYKQAPKAIGGGLGFSAGASLGAKAIPLAIAAVGTPLGIIAGGAVALASGIAGAGVGHKVGEALSEPILGESPEVLTGTEGKSTTEAIKTFSDVMGGSVPAMFSKKVSNLAASSLVKKMSDQSGKKAVKTIDDAVNSFREYARENKGIYALSESIAAGGAAGGAALATEMGYDEGWGRLGFEFVGGVGSSVGAAGLIKLLPVAYSGGKKALTAGAGKLGEEAVEGSNKEARFFVEEFKKYAEDTNQMDELAETIEALDKGAFHALEMQNAVRKAMQEHPDKFTASQRKLLLEGEDIDLTTGQLAGDTTLSRMQRIVQDDNRDIQKQEEAQDSLLNIITNLYLDELVKSGDEAKIAEYVTLHQGKLDKNLEKIYEDQTRMFFQAQDKVFGPSGEALDEAEASVKLAKQLYSAQNKISRQMKKMYDDLDTNVPVFTREGAVNNINNLDSDQYPKYMRVFDEEVGNINSIHFFNNLQTNFRSIFNTINDQRKTLGIGDIGELLKIYKSDPLKKLRQDLIKEGNRKKVRFGNDDPEVSNLIIDFLKVSSDGDFNLKQKLDFFTENYEIIKASNQKNNIKKGPKKALESMFQKAQRLTADAQSKVGKIDDFINKRGTITLDDAVQGNLGEMSTFSQVGKDVTFGELSELRSQLLAAARETTNYKHARTLNNMAQAVMDDLENFGVNLAKKNADLGSAYIKVNNFAKQSYDFLDRTFLKDILKKSNNQLSKDNLKEASLFRKYILDEQSDITALNMKGLIDFADFADKNIEKGSKYKEDIKVAIAEAYRKSLVKNKIDRQFRNEVRPRSKELPESASEELSQMYLDSSKINTNLNSTEKILKDLYGLNIKGEKLLDSNGQPVKGVFSGLDLPQLNDLRDDLIKFGHSSELLQIQNTELIKKLQEESVYDWIKAGLGEDSLTDVLRQVYMTKDSSSLTKLDNLFKVGQSLESNEEKLLFKNSILKLLINHAKDSSQMSVNGKTVDSAEKFYEILFGRLPSGKNNKDSLMSRAVNNGAISKTDFDKVKTTAELYRKAGEYEKLKKMSDLKDPSGLTDPSPTSMFTKFLGKLGLLKAASAVSSTLNTGTASLSIAGYFGRLSDKIFDRLPSQLKDNLRNKVFTDPKLTSKLLKLSKAENRVETEAAEKDFVNAALQSLKEDYPAKLLGFFLGPVVTRMEGSIGREEAEENLLFMQELKKLPALKDAFVEEAGEAATLVGQAAAPMAQDAIDGLRSGLSSVGNFVGNLSLPDLPNKSSGGANMNNLIRKASLPQEESFLASLTKDSGIASLSKKPGEFDPQLYTELFENKNMG